MNFLNLYLFIYYYYFLVEPSQHLLERNNTPGPGLSSLASPCGWTVSAEGEKTFMFLFLATPLKDGMVKCPQATYPPASASEVLSPPPQQCQDLRRVVLSRCFDRLKH